MECIIDRLEQYISNQCLTVLDRRNDGFTYAISIKNETSVFMVYTTRTIFRYHENCCLRVLEMTEHLHFDAVEPWPGGDFIMPYTLAIARSGKCVANYDRSFTFAEVAQMLSL